MKRSRLAREIVEIIVLSLLIFFVIRFFIQSYHIQGPNMQPGLKANQYVLVNKSSYLFHGIERGDVVVLHSPPNPTQDVIGRVVGLPGDAIQIDGTTIRINGVLLNEPYVSNPTNPVAGAWKVPADQYFVLNDNRTVNDDSRLWNSVPKSYIIGKAVLVYWPLPWQFINTYSSTYTQIKTQR